MALPHQNNHQVDSRLYESVGAAPRGRLDTATTPATLVPLFCGDFVSSLDSQSVETDAPVRLETDRLQSVIEILRRKHCRDLQSAVEHLTVKRLKVKEAELETVKQRNKELEEQVTQISDEYEVLFSYAKSTEEAVSGLRTTLDQVLINQSTCPGIEEEERYGESHGDAMAKAVVMISQCVKPKKGRICSAKGYASSARRRRCACFFSHAGTSVSARIDTCPLFNSTRNASIQVLVR